MDEITGQFYAVFRNSYQCMCTIPRLLHTWEPGQLIDKLAATRLAFGCMGPTGPAPTTQASQPHSADPVSTGYNEDIIPDLTTQKPLPRTVHYQPPSFNLDRPTRYLTKEEELGMDVDKGYQPIFKSSTGEDMGVLGQVTFAFKINDTPFTQSFIVCRHMTRHMILGTDFTAMNFMGVIWTREGMQKFVHSNGKTIIELPDLTSGVHLVLGHSVKICPGGHLTVPVECTRPVTDKMGIRMDIRFHHRNPNVYIPSSFVNNPNNKYNPKYMPLTIFNFSKVDHLYIGRDTVIAFTDVPESETYNVEIASEDKIKEDIIPDLTTQKPLPRTVHYQPPSFNLDRPTRYLTKEEELGMDVDKGYQPGKTKKLGAQRPKTLPEIPSDTAFICSPVDVPGHRKVYLHD